MQLISMINRFEILKKLSNRQTDSLEEAEALFRSRILDIIGSPVWLGSYES